MNSSEQKIGDAEPDPGFEMCLRNSVCVGTFIIQFIGIHKQNVVLLEHTKINPRKAGFTRAAWPRAAWRSASDLAPAAAWRKSSGQGWWLPRFIVARVYVPTHLITSLKLNCI
jgi:hypothetical protein